MTISLKTLLTPVGAGVSDHALLTGLADDDHPQYNLLVADEGVTKTTKAESLNFVGAGVEVTNTGDAIVVTINPPVKITVGTSAPGSPSVGDLWVDTN